MKNQILHTLFMMVFFPIFALAQNPGNLDQSFGDNGFVTIDIDGQGLLDRVSKLSQQPDGKTVFVGAIRNASGTQSDFLLGRINTNGNLDTAFGSNGTVTMDLGGDSESLSGIFIDNEQKILAVGTSDEIGLYKHVLLQFNENGNLNLTFGDNGMIYNSPIPSGSVLTSFAVDNEGNLFITGTGNGDLLIVKHAPNGIPDNTFGVSGSVTHDLGSTNESATKSIIQNDGKIIIAGNQLESSEDVLIVRLLPDGALDLSFNTIGWINLSLSEWVDRVTDIVLLPNGKLLAIGSVSEGIGLDYEIFALRLMPDGSYDNSFGTNGIARYDIGAGDDYASTVELQPDGKALIGGGINENNKIANEDFLVMRINEDGSLDQSFGNNGVVVTEISSSYERIIDMELQSDGMLVVAGTAKIGSSEDVALARYHTGLNISVPEVADQTEISVYPNPATETIMVKSESRMRSVELLDALGRSVLLHSVNANQLQLDLSKIPDGIYLLRASDGERVFTKKVVKE
jgi:uncharacterized delta-60 repeat protein